MPSRRHASTTAVLVATIALSSLPAVAQSPAAPSAPASPAAAAAQAPVPPPATVIVSPRVQAGRVTIAYRAPSAKEVVLAMEGTPRLPMVRDE